MFIVRSLICIVCGLYGFAGVSRACAQASDAHAQNSTEQQADSLFNEGKSFLAKRDYASACPRFAASYALDAATGTLLALAICHEGAGELDLAHREYLEVVTRSEAEGRADRARAAQEKADAIAARLPAVASVPNEPAAAETTVVDTEVKLPSVDEVMDWTPPPVHKPTARKPTATKPRHVERSRFTASELAGLGMLGASVLSAGIGVVYTAIAIDKNNASKSGCNSDLCNDSARRDRLDALAAGDIATLTLGAGAALLIAGGITYWASGDDRDSRAVHASAWLLPNSTGAYVGGAF